MVKIAHQRHFGVRSDVFNLVPRPTGIVIVGVEIVATGAALRRARSAMFVVSASKGRWSSRRWVGRKRVTLELKHATGKIGKMIFVRFELLKYFMVLRYLIRARCPS